MYRLLLNLYVKYILPSLGAGTRSEGGGTEQARGVPKEVGYRGDVKRIWTRLAGLARVLAVGCSRGSVRPLSERGEHSRQGDAARRFLLSKIRDGKERKGGAWRGRCCAQVLRAGEGRHSLDGRCYSIGVPNGL